jgi:DNA invertase Pin-like site-specific DNA recombinase
MNVAVYVRVSTTCQEATNQLRDLRQFCRKSGWDIYDEYVDVISGTKDSRPAFDRLFSDAHKKLFDVVLFWDLSRFSRSGTLFTLQKLTELQNLGIAWLSYQEPYFRSLGPFKDVVVSILSTLAKIERQQISSRTKAGLRLAKARGKKLGRPKKRINEDRILEEYKKQGSINRAAKVLPYSYGVVWKVIKKRLFEKQG